MDRTVDTHTLQVVVFRRDISVCHNIAHRIEDGLCIVWQRYRGSVVALRL